MQVGVRLVSFLDPKSQTGDADWSSLRSERNTIVMLLTVFLSHAPNWANTHVSTSVNVQARTKLVQQVRRLSQALKAADKGSPVRSGRVSRKTFAKALEKEGGLGRVREAELTR